MVIIGGQEATTSTAGTSGAAGTAEAGGTSGAPIGAGTTVEVHCRFDQRWTTGFTVVDVSDLGYRIRRTSDGSVLPAWFPREQLRPLRRRSPSGFAPPS